MPQTSLEPSPSVKRFPPEHWHALWLEKTRKACGRKKIKESTAAGFGDFIARFRAVNLVTAAVQFLYIHVLGMNLAVEALPRMKSGRPLPKVYSEQEIEKIISSTCNVTR